jgi:hypothetical protein
MLAVPNTCHRLSPELNMDLMPKQIIIIVFAQSILAIVLLVGYARRSRRAKTAALESGAAPTAETVGPGPQSWLWVAGAMLLFAAVLLLWRPVSTWYWSRHPPSIEHRSELLEAASKELRCPAEQLTIEPFEDTGANVTGCERNTRLCWRVPSRYQGPAWLACFVPY